MFKPLRNEGKKSQALMVILYYYWVMLDRHSEILKVISECMLFGWKKCSIYFEKQYKSNFDKYEKSPRLYSVKDIS